MAQKVFWLDGVGEVTVSKRKGTKTIRLSIGPTGKVRVGMPFWAPYTAGLDFAKRRKDWIAKHQAGHEPSMLTSGARIGKSYRFEFKYEPGRAKTSTSLKANSVTVTSGLAINSPSVQAKAVQAAERALKHEAESLLPDRLKQLADKNGFDYKTVKIKKMTSRWGSCSSDKVITLNYFLMQLPWKLIDYVLVHELVHTKHLNHGQGFWADFEDITPDAKQIRKQMRQYHPMINPLAPVVA